MLPNDSAELPCALITQHLVRLLRVASTLQELDAATYAIQVRPWRSMPSARDVLDTHGQQLSGSWLHRHRPCMLLPSALPEAEMQLWSIAHTSAASRRCAWRQAARGGHVMLCSLGCRRS